MKEKACGCIPWRRLKNGTIEVLMVLRKGGYWEFPKGKQEKGERNEETAIRELKEETNLTGILSLKDTISLSYIYTRDENRIHKSVQFFLCEIDTTAKVTKEKREITDFAWLPLENIEQRATYPEMKEAARSACERLID